MRQRLIPLAVFIILSLLGLNLSINAQSVTFTAQVGDTSLVVNGLSSPNSLILFKENNVVIGTTTSNSLGHFTKKFSALSSGLFILDVYTNDPRNTLSAIVERNLYISEFQELELNDIYLPPTLLVLKQESNFKIDGYTIPNTEVYIQITGSYIKTISTTSDALGYFFTEIAAEELGLGDFNISASISDTLSENIESSNYNFQIVDNDNSNTVIIPINEESKEDTNEIESSRRLPLLNWQAFGDILGEEGLDYLKENPKIVPSIVVTSLLTIAIIIIIFVGTLQVIRIVRRSKSDE